MGSEIRLAIRRLAKEPALAMAAVFTLALGIGACTAMFSIVEAVLLKSMDVVQPQRLVVMWPQLGDTAGEFNYNAYLELSRQSATFERVALSGSANWPVPVDILLPDGRRTRATQCAVSDTFFDVLGARPLLGRTFHSGEDRPGAPPAIVVSSAFWKTKARWRSGRRRPHAGDRPRCVENHRRHAAGVFLSGWRRLLDTRRRSPCPQTILRCCARPNGFKMLRPQLQTTMAIRNELRRVRRWLLRRFDSKRRLNTPPVGLPETDLHPIVTANQDSDRISPASTFGFTGLSGEDVLGTMRTEELSSWENRDVPSIDRVSDDDEAHADERQDVTTSLNFPLHWTSAFESWGYLFDIAVACELLAPRPDDLVLDYAAGTCWATELLNRLGVRTVSLDLSLEMMRRGRNRLEADSRLMFRNDARFVVARGQALPFGQESFDGVLCLNALHHQPSYAMALREIHRVLKPGGRAVFSEPGTAHPVQPLSVFRMREERVLEKLVSLPHIRRLAMEVGFTRMRVVPLRSTAAYVFDYAATADDACALTRMWEDTLRLSPREHARFVLDKGDNPPPDTFLPAHRLVGRLAAEIVFEQISHSTRLGQPFTDRLLIRNRGDVTWKARGRRFGGQVTCGLKVCDEHGQVLREDLGRTPLPYDIPPGGEIEIAMTVDGVIPTGRFILRYDMVVEGVTWFEFQGSSCPQRSLDVTT
jgi:SAM-dependent methyltransferase